jgi:exoribonuclease-2
VPVKLVRTDSVHGFIDFEYASAVDQAKEERLERKRAAATRLQERIGESFDAVVTGMTQKATWISVDDGAIEGRLVRGRDGLHVGDALRVVLLVADPQRGFIDFARDA